MATGWRWGSNHYCTTAGLAHCNGSRTAGPQGQPSTSSVTKVQYTIRFNPSKLVPVAIWSITFQKLKTVAVASD